jgi:rhamnogalacturonyl hydrolase YesR
MRAASEEQKAAGYDRACQVRWCWADALFMAPPGWTALSSVTKDPKYLEYSDREYWATHASLYRKLEDGSGLFLRDSRFYSKADAKGNLVYWSRGNGWVFAGLPAIIDYLPSSHPSRPRNLSATLLPENFSFLCRYIQLFQEMAKALKAAQLVGTFAGFWPPSLREPDLIPFPESSGTAFFVGGFAWGIKNGLLASADYLPTVQKGWQALKRAQRQDGRLGYVQPMGSEPGEVGPDATQLYGSGALLQAAARILSLLEASPGAT